MCRVPTAHLQLPLRQRRDKSLFCSLPPSTLRVLWQVGRTVLLCLCAVLGDGASWAQGAVGSTSDESLSVARVMRCNSSVIRNNGRWLMSGTASDEAASKLVAQSRVLLGVDPLSMSNNFFEIGGSVKRDDLPEKSFHVRFSKQKSTLEVGDSSDGTSVDVDGMWARKANATHLKSSDPRNARLTIQLLPLVGEQLLPNGDTSAEIIQTVSQSNKLAEVQKAGLQTVVIIYKSTTTQSAPIFQEHFVTIDTSSNLPTEERFCETSSRHPDQSYEVRREFADYKRHGELWFPRIVTEYLPGNRTRIFTITKFATQPIGTER